MVHACTHTTIAPTIAHGGVKTNVIPDRVDLQVDIRTLPGQTDDDIRAMLFEAIGPDLSPRRGDRRRRGECRQRVPRSTRRCGTRWRASARALVPGASTIPFLLVGATDARFFRWAGATAYGYGLFSDRISFADFGSMFHGDDERIDQESLRLSELLWEAVARDFLG